MPLIKSVSGIRGTIGGKPGDNLTPADIVSFVAAYARYLHSAHKNPTVVIGRDGRISGNMVKQFAIQTLVASGIDVVDLDYSTTPTVEMYVKASGASGGIIITASHNPAEWNALKFLNNAGEFISPEIGETIRNEAESGSPDAEYAQVMALGKVTADDRAIQQHIDSILAHPLIDAATIKKAGLSVVADCINSTGSISLPPLFEALGVRYSLINDDVTGVFAHNPEPLPAHLTDLCNAVKQNKADAGISVDPDVDRLALVDEHGVFFGEEYTLVCAADYVLRHTPGPVVTNLSSSRALGDLAKSFGTQCFYAPVGEVHVVREMKARNAVLGGEGNGGVIDPALHYGRDSLMGVALILMHLATSGKSLSTLKSGYPAYEMVKDKVAFDPSMSPDSILKSVANHFKDETCDTRDGLKVDFETGWVHLRKSNTEPILRIYAESATLESAQALVTTVRQLVEAHSG